MGGIGGLGGLGGVPGVMGGLAYPGFIVVDLFDGSSADAAGRAPNQNTAGGTWSYSGGATWSVNGSGVLVPAGTIAGNDDEIYINVGTPNQDIRGTFNIAVNDIVVLMGRRTSALTQMLLVAFQSSQTLTMYSVKEGEADEAVATSAATIPASTNFTMRFTLNSSNLCKGYVNDLEILSVTVAESTNANFAGLECQQTTNQFLEFRVAQF